MSRRVSLHPAGALIVVAILGIDPRPSPDRTFAADAGGAWRCERRRRAATSVPPGRARGAIARSVYWREVRASSDGEWHFAVYEDGDGDGRPPTTTSTNKVDSIARPRVTSASRQRHHRLPGIPQSPARRRARKSTGRVQRPRALLVLAAGAVHARRRSTSRDDAASCDACGVYRRKANIRVARYTATRSGELS